MDVTFDHIIVHQPVDHIGGLTFGGADHRGIPHQVAHVDEGCHADPLVFPQILERVVGVQGIHRHPEFLAIAGGMQDTRAAAVDVRQTQPVSQL